jgi:hypothetical protein
MSGPMHETRDLPPLAIVAAIGGVFALIAAAAVVAALLLGQIERHSRPPAATAFPPQARLGPPLEVDDSAERKALEAEARERLAAYGWTDRGAGIARIPIERAMAILGAEGWPDPPAPAP